jgi:hypothetical protein
VLRTADLKCVCTGNPIPFLAGHFSHLGHPTTTTTTTTQGENNFFGKSDSSPNRIKKVFILFYFIFYFSKPERPVFSIIS